VTSLRSSSVFFLVACHICTHINNNVLLILANKMIDIGRDVIVLGLGLGLALRTINNSLAFGLGLIGQCLGLGLVSLGLGQC